MKQRLLLILSLLSIRVLSPVRDQLDHCFYSVLSVPIGEIRGFSRTAGLKPPTAARTAGWSSGLSEPNFSDLFAAANANPSFVDNFLADASGY